MKDNGVRESEKEQRRNCQGGKQKGARLAYHMFEVEVFSSTTADINQRDWVVRGGGSGRLQECIHEHQGLCKALH